uniref:Uncharacterized protein n=1 Tax=viral metagenome TaxID=1070528 RepID=A0A6M3L7E1_9ZZZZ
MQKLKIGDKVKVSVWDTLLPGRWKKNLTGVVRDVPEDGTILVEVDNGQGKGHNGAGFSGASINSYSSNAWWFGDYEVELAEDAD